MPVGENTERRADVRIVAATNEDMEKSIADGRFREDLYHRLCEFEIHQPSLAECPEDILPLAEFFRKKFSGRKSGTIFATLSFDVLRIFKSETAITVVFEISTALRTRF